MNKEKANLIMNQTTQGYNMIGKEFSASRNTVWPEMIELVDKYVKKADRVLDVGCGNGRLVKILDVKNYVGIDSSVELISQARLNYPEVKFVVWDMMELDKFNHGMFDVVFLFASFNHIAHKKMRAQVLERIKEILNPGGYVIMTNWNLWRWEGKKNIWHYTKGLSRDVVTTWSTGGSDNYGQLYYRVFNKRELKNIFKQAGFVVQENYYSLNNLRVGWWRGKNIVTVGKKIN